MSNGRLQFNSRRGQLVEPDGGPTEEVGWRSQLEEPDAGAERGSHPGSQLEEPDRGAGRCGSQTTGRQLEQPNRGANPTRELACLGSGQPRSHLTVEQTGAAGPGASRSIWTEGHWPPPCFEMLSRLLELTRGSSPRHSSLHYECRVGPRWHSKCPI
ncbi:uncharacterized protein LOC123399762 [Hordeum vulgare subsp. vulgare]|uniref:uncharacterized protein LOC123399762 n=1 Tax=Hordeum vulgare subsp. vulgare TaxID=112509 RepID=UPI001D1A3775|nr:uncharacterized protein LOC123399762 [Hordeum vulgare subsp. vulgare]